MRTGNLSTINIGVKNPVFQLNFLPGFWAWKYSL